LRILFLEDGQVFQCFTKASGTGIDRTDDGLISADYVGHERIAVDRVRERLEADLYDWLSAAPNI
jgi:hypothetical protein